MKALEGNMDFKDNNCKASYSQLKELFLVFKHIFTHFENLTKQVENGEFDNYPSITRSINETWNKVKDYYNKID
jgi:hypothetical protein